MKIKSSGPRAMKTLALSNITDYSPTSGTRIDAVDQNDILKTAYDANGKKANDHYQKTISGKTVQVYPWGDDNLLIQRCTSLIRSNGDAMNLIGTRADFLFGGGVDFFQEVLDGEEIAYKTYRNPRILKYRDKLRINELVSELITSLAETWCFVVRKEMQKDGMPKLSWVDPSTFRWVKLKDKNKFGALSPDWNDEAETSRSGVIVSIISDSDESDGLIFKKIGQVGQPYYPRPTYWTEQALDFVETMNFCSAKIRQSTKSNNNIGQITSISEEYITDLAHQSADLDTNGENEEDEGVKRARVRDDIYGMMNEFMFSGTRTMIFDECRTDPQTGKMIPNITITDVNRSLNTKEYSESYELSLRGFANSGGVLAGLTGLSDGGKLGGSGSELKVSANYQQTFRTNRERLLITTLIDRTYRKFLQLPDDVVVRFRNLILVNDNADKSGVSSTMKTEANPKS